MSVPVTIERIQPVNIRQPERTPSYPAWLALRVGLIKEECQPDPETGRWRTVPTLPANSTLSETERDEIGRHVRELQRLYGPTPGDGAEVEGEMLIAITRMMLVLPTTTQNEASAEARAEAFLDALDDVPVWTVKAAIRRWNRNEAGTNERGESYDTHWQPSPADLRSVALSELARVRCRAVELSRVLRAEPLIEYSDEHCHEMRQRLSNLVHVTFNIPLADDTAPAAERSPAI